MGRRSKKGRYRFSDICLLVSELKLRSAGAGYNFLQGGVNFFQQVAGLHAFGKQGPVGALQAGALDEGADIKIELIVWFSGNWIHYTTVCGVHT